ncbi:hypothetical protein Taro_012680, partial [Colocasia esculenta]|nr:hypothetical protein [Colocasia esculenta]
APHPATFFPASDHRSRRRRSPEEAPEVTEMEPFTAAALECSPQCYIATAVALLAGGLFLVAYLYAPYWGVRKVPGPPLTPVLGHLPLLAKYGPDVFGILAKQYGPIYRFHMGRQPLVIVADPELCREVGIKKFKSVGNRSLPSPISGSPLHQKGLFFTRDSRWSAMRNTIISLYQPSHLANLIPTMQSYIDSAFLHLSSAVPGESLTFSDLSLKLATDVIGQAAFGVDFGLSKAGGGGGRPEESNDVRGRGDDGEVAAFVQQHVYSTTSLKMDLSGSLSIVLGLLAPVLQEPFRQVLKRIPGTADWKIDRVNRDLSRRVDGIVARRAREGGAREGNRDFLSAILSSREAGGAAARELFTADYVSALTYEHLLAGSATTSFTLSSVLYLVAGHPEVERKLLAEVDAFGPPPEVVPSAEDLQHRLPYLDQVGLSSHHGKSSLSKNHMCMVSMGALAAVLQVIKEAMRFYTVSPLVAREASQPVEVGGYHLPKGTWIWLALGVLAKDPRHFPEPHLFRPERFDPDGEEEKCRHPYAHIPFGIGPRACIGQRFSLQEIKLSLVHLYRRYVFRHSPEMESPLALDYGIVLNFKHGVKLQVIRRAAAAPCSGPSTP